MNIDDMFELPPNLPIPEDDGACRHLTGAALPDLELQATDGTKVNLSRLDGLTVVFMYPRTGVPGIPPLVSHWDEIPGARGCTLQTAGYRDQFQQFTGLGARVFALSTQTTDYQQEMVQRLELPFPALSDSGLLFSKALNLPLFTVSDEVLLKRMSLVIESGRISKVFYPVFPPNKNAGEVLAWLKGRNSAG